ncbi:hypothetical protein [Verminephrobacter aporrectodeae]|uniref:hypothetical protein n=1 Tax=Verminephrobacter aporrectodeae TaxID=1110389 RepID=UPI002238DD62|nr:hypothetical protein [Verminephrobacter aporrectodeae]
MQRIQPYKLLMVCTIVAMGACSQEDKVLTVPEYLHDIDKAEALRELRKTNPGKYKRDDPAMTNALAALSKIYQSESIYGTHDPKSLSSC